jgi:transposase
VTTQIWDGLGAHKSQRMRAVLARQRGWLTVERLPAYALELNPIEPVATQRMNPEGG